MQKKIISLLLSQYFISFCIAVFLIYFSPDYFLKYKMELKSQEHLARDCNVYFEDLDKDGKSEKILLHKNVLNNITFEIFNSNDGLVDQFNLATKFPDYHKDVSFLDADENGFKEMYVVSKKKDSAFLNIIEPFGPKAIGRNKIFIDTIVKFKKEYLFNTSSFKLSKSLSYSNNQVLFILETGYSGYPRNVYKYNYLTNKISKSPHLTNRSAIYQIEDLNNNGENEILLHNYSAGNELDSSYTSRSDYSSWLTVLDSKLNFLFNPVEIDSPFSGLWSFPFKTKDSYKIFCLVNSKQGLKYPSRIMLFTIKGKKLQEKVLSIGWYYKPFLNKKKKEFIIIDKTKGTGIILNYNLKEVGNFQVNPNSDLYQMDIDNDGKKEWLNYYNDKSNITIYRENFKNPVSIQLPTNSSVFFKFGLKQLNKHKNQLYIQKGKDVYLYNYAKNQNYIFKYLFFIAVYVFVLGVVFLIIKGQKLREAKKKAIEKEILQLQLKTIKNQVDSHFVFNAINTISEMKLTDDKLAADDFICKFSDFMRKTLQQSDSITNTLEEELAYVENYLQLQKVRFNNAFTFEIKTPKQVNLKMLVPKHVVFTYVENAVKHGLSHKKNGLLTINIKKKKKGTLLTIEDNGGGINTKNQNKRNSTGNGLLIMEKIYTYYTQLTKQKIKHHLSEVTDSENKVTGLKIEIEISK